MSKPYSYYLRHAVIQAIELDGWKITEASQKTSTILNSAGLG